MFGTQAPQPAIVTPVEPGGGLYRNDVINNCVIASVANALRAAAKSVTGADRYTTDEAIVAVFAIVAGVSLSAVGTVPGLTPLDALEWIETNGFAAGGPVVEAFSDLTALSNQSELCGAVARHGAAIVAVNLFSEDEFSDAQWRASPVGTIVGGHAMTLIGYTPNTVTLVTWGQVVTATWEWITTRLVSAYGMHWAL